MKELPIVLPIYDKKEKQQMYKENSQRALPYELISPIDRFLPFQIFLGETMLNVPNTWLVWRACGTISGSINSRIHFLKCIRTERGYYIIYNGEDMALTMDEGERYFFELIFDTGERFYSEIFTARQNLSKYMKFEFWNSSDLFPINYTGTGFKQIMYLDSYVHTSEPDIEEEIERDGNNMAIPVFQKMAIRHRASVLVPDFIKTAITSLQMHSEVFLTTNEAVREDKIDRITTTSVVEFDGAYSTIDILMEELLLVKNSCENDLQVINPNVWE